MQSFLPLTSWETEVWVAEEADHIIHFNGERFPGPYPDARPAALGTAPPPSKPRSGGVNPHVAPNRPWLRSGGGITGNKQKARLSDRFRSGLGCRISTSRLVRLALCTFRWAIFLRDLDGEFGIERVFVRIPFG